MTRPFFSRDRISDFDNFARHADDILSQMKARFREGYAVDFQVSTPLTYNSHRHGVLTNQTGCHLAFHTGFGN